MNLLESALNYEKRGFSIIPVNPSKRPYIKWEPYQKQRATAEEIRAWWTQWPNAKIGLVTGSISDLTVLDTDNQEALDELQGYLSETFLCPIETTPRGGRHYFFANGNGIRNCNDRSPHKFHVRREGGYIIVSPSKGYKWLDGLSIEEVVPPPIPNTLYISLINAFREGERNFKTSKEEQTNQEESRPKQKMFENGVRDESIFHTANCLVKGGMPREEISQVPEVVMESWGEGHEEKWREEKFSLL